LPRTTNFTRSFLRATPPFACTVLASIAEHRLRLAGFLIFYVNTAKFPRDFLWLWGDKTENFSLLTKQMHKKFLILIFVCLSLGSCVNSSGDSLLGGGFAARGGGRMVMNN
jgi:hypothetical protein